MAVAAVWPWCGVSVRGTPLKAVGCPVRGEGDPGDTAVTAGCRRGTPFSTSAMSPGLGTASRWVEDTPRGGHRVAQHQVRPCGDSCCSWLPLPTSPSPALRGQAGWHVSVCHPMLDGVLSPASAWGQAGSWQGTGESPSTATSIIILFCHLLKPSQFLLTFLIVLQHPTQFSVSMGFFSPFIKSKLGCFGRKTP